MSFAFSHLLTATLNCHLVDAKNFSADANFNFNLNTTVGPLVVDGYTLIPAVDLDGPNTQLALKIAINPTVIAQLTVGLTIVWKGEKLTAGFNLTVADIGGDLAALENAIIAWLRANVATLFASFLTDAEAWLEAVVQFFSGLLDDIDNIAGVLAHYFAVGIDDVAAYLMQLGYGFMAIVDALVDAFRIAFDQAVAIVEELWGECSMGLANTMAYSPPPAVSLRDLQFALTGTARGQRMLLVYHGHGPENLAPLARASAAEAAAARTRRVAARRRGPRAPGRDLRDGPLHRGPAGEPGVARPYR